MSALRARAGRERKRRVASGMRSRRRDGRDFFAGLEETLFDLCERQAKEGGAGGEHEIAVGRHEMLVAAVEIAETALGAVAVDGVADRGSGGDHADARSGGRLGGALPPSKQKGPAINAAALFPHGAKVVIAPQALPGAQEHP
jgi:hypothetical protein